MVGQKSRKGEKDAVFMTILPSKNCITCHTQRMEENSVELLAVKQWSLQEAGQEAGWL